MKVRFSSRKESNPTEEGGLRVLYAPGKRAAYRLRWYLILLLVATPFLWFLGRIGWEVLVIEAPGQVVQPITEIRALEAGRVMRINPEEHDQVSPGDELVQLDNPALRAKLASLDTLATANAATAAGTRQKAALERRLERARNRVESLAELVQQGVATQGEFQAAENEVDARENELAALERTSAEEIMDTKALTTRLERQRALVEQQLAQLTIHSPVKGTVHAIEVVAGENVGPGTTLMRIEPMGEPRIHLYLDTDQIDLATVGQPVKLQFPDGQWLDARIAGHPIDVQRRPPSLRSAFGGDDQSLLVAAIPEGTIPERWRVNEAPVTARFPNALTRWFSEPRGIDGQ
ncbi:MULTISPECIES: HlyD family secretion protein [Halomonadaceae]|uniref:HlyD family efflux transporter periplasmic adaptor subunit n=1 Tax=Vreelandella halophila TaxID=86177 RepID=A0A9X4YBJ9_9GAMM|nr:MULTISPECIES: HlyD family efflux transporter periplasmic adaptor subunit [Halomonas]MYL26205.1 HlyD family efflux transporter periplasmic adaptor subunit [Halomonas utahensis]MYL73233.1 HlyD family efflux transporter periplasmic adaptor subunit [Halomonas sp. 22501_18_FS]